MCLAIPGRIEAIYQERGLTMGRIDFGGVIKEICMAYLPEAVVGDYALVHVGFAIARIDEQAAEETLARYAEAGLVVEADGDAST